MYVMFWMQILQRMTELYFNFNWIDVNNNTTLVAKQKWRIEWDAHARQNYFDYNTTKAKSHDW